MIITRRCIMSGDMLRMDLAITISQLDLWKGGMPAQDAFPHLDARRREFIISGITPEQWDCLFGDEP